MAAAAVSTSPMLDLELDVFHVDKLSYQIFSILENKFLFGSCDQTDLTQSPVLHQTSCQSTKRFNDGRVRILSIDGGGATDGILAANSLAHLESFLRRKSGNPNAHISDYFDLVAGSGAGGILAALLFTSGKGGRPIFTAEEALSFVIQNRRKILRSSGRGAFRRIFRSSKVEKLLSKTFGECTLKDTIKPILIPCYDLSTRAAFVFSRADAMEMDGYDFKMKDVCMATSADPTVKRAMEMKSVDGRTKILAVNGGITMNNPTATAITHVLNNKHEFPFCNGVENVLVVSIGNGESDFGIKSHRPLSPSGFVRIATDGASDMVDQAVSMAFAQHRATNYARIQTNVIIGKNHGRLQQAMKCDNDREILSVTEEILSEKSYESVLFKGKKTVEKSNMEKLEMFGSELMKEQERRRTSILPFVALKNGFPTPRSSSATSLSTTSSC